MRTTYRRLTRAAALGTALATVGAVAVGWASTSHNPVGSFDSAVSTSTGVTVVGGAADPDSTAPVQVRLTSDGALVAAMVANAAVHGGHGWVTTLSLSVGTHTVCATAINVGAGANTVLGCKSVIVAHDPQGSLDYVVQRGAGAFVVGGAVDPDAPTQPASVRVTVDSQLVTTAVANQAVHGGHGYVLQIAIGAGTHTVCTTGVNVGPGADRLIGCKSVTINLNPIGSLDSVAQHGATAYVVGGTSDPDNPASTLSVNITVGGQVVRTITANQPVHGGHGYVTTVPVGDGSQTICAIAINVGLGANTTLGCRTVTFHMGPVGSLDSVVQRGTGLFLVGGASDPNVSGPIQVRTLVDGTTVATWTANQAVHGGHGYSGVVPIKTAGAHSICTVGVNVGPGSDTNLGCKTVTVQFNPYGAFETSVRVGSTSIRVTGWAIDPTDPTTAVTMHISVDGVTMPITVANQSRPDIAARYPGTGSDHGFDATVNANVNEHTVCVVAMNIGLGTNTTIGCRLVNALHPVAPSAPTNVTATASYGSATVSWTRSSSDGGAPVSSYRITSNPAGASVTVPGTASSAVVAGLHVNAVYTFTVVAVNVAGASAGSVSNAIRTPNAPPPQTTPAPVATSRYTRNINGAGATMVNQMFREGASDAAGNPSGHSYLVLLDIGGQDEPDHGVVLTAGVRFVSYTDLVTNLKYYVDGYGKSQKSNAPVTIALGTNNDMDTSASSGASWANNVVDPIQAFAARYPNIRIAGADDMEPGFRASMSATKSWLQGYLGATSAPFVFNGSADGCGWTTTNSSCNNGWNHAGLYYLAGGASPTRIINLPQIYNNTMAAQWKYISLTGVGAHQPRINFGGPLTEYTACAQAGSCYSMTGHDAWVALWNQLQSNSALKVGSLPNSTDLRIDS